MYTDRNFKTKKALKEAVAARLAYLAAQKLAADTGPMTVGAIIGAQIRPANPVTVYQPGPFGGNPPTSGRIFLEGPHYPEPHRWWSSAILENGEVVKVG